MCCVIYEQQDGKILSFICATFSGYSCLTVPATRQCETPLPFFFFLSVCEKAAVCVLLSISCEGPLKGCAAVFWMV